MEDGLIQNLQNEISTSSSTPDEATRNSKRSIYQDQFDAATLENFLQNQISRKKYSHRIFIITSCWLVSVLAILILTGWKILDISDNVILGLLGSTTVNVLGFFVIVIQYLFNKDKST